MYCLPLRYYYEQNKSINEKELRPTGLSSFFRSDYSFLCDPFKLAQCWRVLSRFMRKFVCRLRLNEVSRP